MGRPLNKKYFGNRNIGTGGYESSDDFIGGELEYIEETKRNQINVKENLGIILDEKTLHRVLPVTTGIRYSLVCFFVEANTKVRRQFPLPIHSPFHRHIFEICRISG